MRAEQINDEKLIVKNKNPPINGPTHKALHYLNEASDSGIRRYDAKMGTDSQILGHLHFQYHPRNTIRYLDSGVYESRLISHQLPNSKLKAPLNSAEAQMKSHTNSWKTSR